MARVKCSGLARRARFAMSHASGKIEGVGLTLDQIFFKVHRAAKNGKSGKFMAFKRNPNAYGFDDYIEAQDANTIDFPLSALNVKEWVDWGLMDKS